MLPRPKGREDFPPTLFHYLQRNRHDCHNISNSQR